MSGEYYTKDFSPERDYICALSESDRVHQCNSMGALSGKNAYGELWWRDEKYPDGGVVICGHGGSMWLCRECKEDLLANRPLRNPLPDYSLYTQVVAQTPEYNTP